MSDPEISQMMYVLQVLEEQKKMISEQIGFSKNHISGLNLSKKTMVELQNIKENHEIIIPLGANAFTKAKIIDPNQIIISIANNIFIEKNLEDSIGFMGEKIDSYSNIQEKLIQQYKDVSEKILQIRPQIDAYYSNSLKKN